MVVEGVFGRLKGHSRCVLKRYDSEVVFLLQTANACCTMHIIGQMKNEYFDEEWHVEVQAHEDNAYNRETDIHM